MLLRASLALAGVLIFSGQVFASSLTFNGTSDYATGAYGYYYQITGGKYPTGTDPNGDNASGGTFRFINDEPLWGYPVNVWNKDDWFTANAGLAVTLIDGATTVYDNNGIEDGSYGNFYDAQAQGTANADTPGLYRAYGMPNNWDWMYASYLKLEQDTEITQIIAYFDANGAIFDLGDNAFDPNSPSISYIMNFWTTNGADCTVNGVGCLPTNTGSFVGDAFSTAYILGTFSTSLTGVNRVFSDGSTDPIARLVFTLDQPFVLPAGEYFFGSGALITPEPGTLALFGLGLLMGNRALRRRRR